MKNNLVLKNRSLELLSVSKKRVIFACIVFALGVVFANTIAELLVAIQNKYTTYPAGTDTNMLFYSTMVARIFAVFVSVWSVIILRLKPGRQVLTVFMVLSIVALSLSYLKFFPSFVPKNWCKYELSIYPCK